MPKEINTEVAGTIFECLHLEVSNVVLAPKRHAGGSIFCGYVDFALSLRVRGTNLPVMALLGNAIKILNGRLHFDPKKEKGEDGDWYPIWLPISPESRAVLTAKLERSPEIQAMLREAVAKVEMRRNFGENNPF